jgi:diguanylate cyclase (GGDEF)-like protein/PAS domain S-box-containing protein
MAFVSGPTPSTQPTPAAGDAEAMLDALPELVNRFRVHDLRILYCNSAWAVHYGVERSEAIGRCLTDFLSADECSGLRAQLDRLGPDAPVVADVVDRSDEAGGRWLEWVDRYLEGPDGPEVLSVGRDVTARHVAEERLAASEARFRRLADNASDIVWHVAIDPAPHFTYMSPSVERILGYEPDLFLTRFEHIIDVLAPDSRKLVLAVIDGDHPLDSADLHLRHANGSLVILETRATEVPGGTQGVSRDVTELRRLQEQLAAHALRDPLTGLANRRLLDELLDSELARSERAGTPLAVAYIDVDGLKQVNDEHGHDAGDVVLRETARRLLGVVRGADVVARIGGDEFVIVYQPQGDAVDALVARLEPVLARPIRVRDDLVVSCPSSIGTADTAATGFDADRLLAAADESMYRMKRARRRDRTASSDERQAPVTGT